MRNDKSPNQLLARIAKLFNEQLALENDYLRQENRILRSKLGKRVPLTDSERGILVKYGLRIKDRLGEVMSIASPETLLRWNRRMKQVKWTFDSTPKKPGRPRKSKDTEALILRLAEDNATWGYWRIARAYPGSNSSHHTWTSPGQVTSSPRKCGRLVVW